MANAPPFTPPQIGALTLSVRDLAIARAGRVLAAGLAFTLQAGQALVVTGPNGAGKSTLLRTIAGLLPAAQGDVQLSPAQPTTGTPLVETASIGASAHYLGHRNAMKDALSARENLAFWQVFDGKASFTGKPVASVDQALTQIGLTHAADTPFGWLSAGQRRRIAIARLLVSQRPLWILDEPTSGLDAAATQTLAALMGEHLQHGGLILAATHLPLGLENAQQLVLAPASRAAQQGTQP